MVANALLSRVLDDDGLTRGLADPEARVLVEWLVDQAEHLAVTEAIPGNAASVLQRLCLRARAIGRFVVLWCHADAPGAAGQLAAAERFAWPLPATRVDPCDLMESILEWEARHLRESGCRL